MNIFGQAVIRGKKWDFSGLPRLFSMDYEAHRALLGEREFLLIEPNESVKPLQMQKLSDLAEEKLVCQSFSIFRVLRPFSAKGLFNETSLGFAVTNYSRSLS